MIDRRRLLASGLAALGAAGCSADGHRAGAALTAVDVHRADYPTVEAIRWFGDELGRETKGRLRLRLYHSGQLGSEDDSIGLARYGGIDITRVAIAAMNNAVPETRVLSLPYAFGSVAHLRAAVDSPLGSRILAAFERRGLIGLAIYDAGARSLYNVRGPIRAPEDLRGLKIRVPQSDIFVAALGAMGANPTPLSYGGVFSALQTRLIDGGENNWPSYESAQHFEVARFWSETQHSHSPDVLLMSKARFDLLTAGDQRLVRTLAAASVPFMRRAWDAAEARSRVRALAAGVRVDAVDRAAFRAATQPMVAALLRDPVLGGLHAEAQRAA